MRRGDATWRKLHQHINAMLEQSQNLKVELDSVAQQTSDGVLLTW